MLECDVLFSKPCHDPRLLLNHKMFLPWARYLGGGFGILAPIMIFRNHPSSLSNLSNLGSHLSESTPESLELDLRGFLPMKKAEQHYCQTRRWKPYPYRNRRRKIYDLFIINSELDWLEIPMGESQEVVDYFVIVEAATTFTDTPKPLYVQEHWARYQPFHPKMIHHVLNDSDVQFDGTWAKEALSRNAMFDQVMPFLDGEKAAGLGDVILVSDVDEIPRPDTLQVLRNCAFPRRLTLRSHFYYYGFQWPHRGYQWPHPQATFFEGPEHTVKPEELRNTNDPEAELWNAAWHCSFRFGRLQDLWIKFKPSHTQNSTDQNLRTVQKYCTKSGME